MEPIKIDLRDLTEAHLEAAKPHVGSCRYSAPCIIGTLIPEGRRGEIDDSDDHIPSSRVHPLWEQGSISIPEDQEDDATAIQERFDEGDWVEVEAIARKWMSAP